VQQRLSLAKELLELTDLSVSEVALQAGYSCFSYFIHLFKRKEGMTPSRYRKVRRS